MGRKSARQIADEAISKNLSLGKAPERETYELLETTTYTAPTQIETAPQQIDFTQRSEMRKVKTMNFDKLPLNLSVNLPDFQSLMSVSDVSDPSSFDAAGYKRVTEQQRALDKVHFAELKNYADNVSDGISVLISMASAAINGAKLGQKMVQYATAREGIETELVNFNIQQSKTTQKRFELDRNIMREGHEAQMNILEGQALQLKVADAKLTLQESKAKFKIRQAEVMALVGG
jgi:hypothetical protein